MSWKSSLTPPFITFRQHQTLMCFIGDFPVTDQPQGVQRCETEGILGNLLQIKNLKKWEKCAYVFSPFYLGTP